MPDETPEIETEGETSGETEGETAARANSAETAAVEQPRSRPAAASAAARARRIGGRVSPGSQATADPAEGADGADSTASAVRSGAAPVKLSKRAAEDGSEPTASPAPQIVVPAWLRWLPAGVLTAGAVAMLVLMIVFSHGVWWGRPAASAVREQMLAATKTCVADTNTYKYTALDKYTTAVHKCTTGRLTSQIEKTITTVIKKYAPTLKATQTAQISRGGLEAVSPHGKQWTVIVFGQLTVVNTNDPKGRTDPFAAQVQMEKVHGKWLMSGLTTVATPVS
jgi:hypothetical protein